MSNFPTCSILIKFVLILFGYFFCYMQWSLVLLLTTFATLTLVENKFSNKVSILRVKHRANAIKTRQDLLEKIHEIPVWVKFPDRERAEWLNQVVTILWPSVSVYVVKFLRKQIETKIRKKIDSFRFEQVEFGCNPPKIDGIKVYNSGTTKGSIIIDFEVFYDGNCNIDCSLSGTQLGGIKDFQMFAEMRIVLSPLLPKPPLIGGIQVFFLNMPDFSFTLDGLSSIPGLNYAIRSKIQERIRKVLVFPNKITKRFTKSIEASELKSIEPAGVLRVHVFEASDLMAKDISGKSDPYAILYVGAQEYKTGIVNQSLNPRWDFWCEFIVIDPRSQHVGFKLYDHDNVNEDDFLGNGEVDIATVLAGKTDQWVGLRGAKHGKIHLRFSWFGLSNNVEVFDAILQETRQLKVATLSTCVLSVFLDSAHDLPVDNHSSRPNPYVTLVVANRKQKSRIKKHSRDPVWEQGFVFLVSDPKHDGVYINVKDKENDEHFGRLTYQIADLLKEHNMEVSKKEFELEDGGRIAFSFQLRILMADSGDLEDESETDSEDSSREGSPKRTVKKELLIEKTAVSQSTAERTKSDTNKLKFVPIISCGKVETTLEYSEARQKFLVTIHRVSNLPLKDPSDIPDPYVVVKLISSDKTHKEKTKVRTDQCEPVYEETFEFLMPKVELSGYVLQLTVKTANFFNHSTIGRIDIKLNEMFLDKPTRTWFQLSPKRT